MNEEQKSTSLDEKKKSALIHYVAILFIVAFIVVLLSMLGTMRNSREDITQLTQSSVSAIQKAEQLQTDNQTLQAENQELKTQLETMTKVLQEAEAAMSAAQEELEAARAAQEANQADADQKVKAAESKQQKTIQAYEELLTAMTHMTPGSQEGNVTVSKALDNLELLKQYLGRIGLEEYESLLEEGE